MANAIILILEYDCQHGLLAKFSSFVLEVCVKFMFKLCNGSQKLLSVKNGLRRFKSRTFWKDFL